MAERDKLPPNELRDVLFGVAVERFRHNRANTLHAFAEEARDAVLERFEITPRDTPPVRYPPDVAMAAERAAGAVLEAWLAGRKSVTPDA